MQRSNLPPETKEEIKRLFYTIANCPKKEVVIESIEEIKRLSGELTKYVEEEIESLLPQFSRAYIDKFTLGYNVSSLSESTNSLIKRDLKACNLTLKDIRIEIIEAFKHKAIIQK